MPRIKRWGPFAHGYNRDPEVRELRRQFGDWMALVWLELCAIGDLNGGIVKGTPEQIGESLAYISMSKRPSLSAKRVTNALQFMRKCGWIAIQTDHVLIVNHLKYHPSENSNPVPPNDRTTERPNIKSPEPPTAAAPLHSLPAKEKPKTLDFRLKVWADQIYRIDTIKFARLIQWIKAAERTYSVVVIASSLERFLPSAREVTEWWPYLDRILDKEEIKFNASYTKQESDRIKRQERAWIKG